MGKKQRKKKHVSEPLPTLEDMSAILAHIVIGINPYLCISTLHIMLTEALLQPMDEEDAWRIGQNIAKRARISITSDSPGGLQ